MIFAHEIISKESKEVEIAVINAISEENTKAFTFVNDSFTRDQFSINCVVKVDESLLEDFIKKSLLDGFFSGESLNTLEYLKYANSRDYHDIINACERILGKIQEISKANPFVTFNETIEFRPDNFRNILSV